MNKYIKVFAIMAVFFGLLITSCVPAKRLDASQARVGKLQQDSVNILSQLTDCNAIVSNLKTQNTAVKDEYALIQTELEASFTASKMTIADQSKRLKTLQDIIQSQKDIMVRLKNSIVDALINFKADELNVNIKDGNVYVSLEEKLLFKSGSDVVDPKGKEALKSLAQVLNNSRDFTVMIEGHTDNVPIKTKLFQDNWDLSTARATSILRILTNIYEFDSNRITASGKGQFHPVKTNDTPEGRAGNRRTEIILSPDLKEIYTLLYQ
jgi:chemotaxis protein MotB